MRSSAISSVENSVSSSESGLLDSNASKPVSRFGITRPSSEIAKPTGAIFAVMSTDVVLPPGSGIRVVSPGTNCTELEAVSVWMRSCTGTRAPVRLSTALSVGSFHDSLTHSAWLLPAKGSHQVEVSPSSIALTEWSADAPPTLYGSEADDETSIVARPVAVCVSGSPTTG